MSEKVPRKSRDEMIYTAIMFFFWFAGNIVVITSELAIGWKIAVLALSLFVLVGTSL